MVRRLKEDNNKSNLFDLRGYFSHLYKQERPPKELVQAYRDFLGPQRSYEYEQERIGENKLGYTDCYCCRCGEYLDKNNCPSGWYTYVSELGDDEGLAWRDFCDTCWDKVSNMSADEILDTFEPAPYGEYLGQNYKTENTNESYKKFNEDNFDLIKDGKKDKKTLDAYTAEIKNLKKELSDCKDIKRKMFLQSTIAQYEKKAKEIEKFLKNTESLRRTRRASVNESYSDINNDNVWEVFDYVKELLTPDGLVENMARWMGLDDLTKCMQSICRTQGINVLEDEEYDEDEEFE